MSRRFGSVLLVGFLGACAAQADLWQNVFRGLGYVATPLGGPLSTTSDGTRINGSRSGRLRIVPNGLGGGYQLEFDRSFGLDTRGRPEVLRFGGAGELGLNGDVQATLGYNGRDFRTYRGDFVINNLGYNLRSKLGGQDASLTGVLNGGASFELNEWGFYNLQLEISNTNSQLELDGVVARDRDDTNFNVGPIVIEGNIFVDGLAALMNGLGLDTTALEELFPKSPIDQLNNPPAVSTVLAETTATAQISNPAPTGGDELAPLLIQTVLRGDATAAERLIEGLAAGTVTNSHPVDEAPPNVLMVPDPGTLFLFAAGAAALGSRRARR